MYRATVDPGNKTLCDVYYYAPDGKKLRSGREVAEHCEYFYRNAPHQHFKMTNNP